MVLKCVWWMCVSFMADACLSAFCPQVLFERVTFDLEELQEAIRIIDKDVPRTDRDLDYYLWVAVKLSSSHPELTSFAWPPLFSCVRNASVLSQRPWAESAASSFGHLLQTTRNTSKAYCVTQYVSVVYYWTELQLLPAADKVVQQPV